MQEKNSVAATVAVTATVARVLHMVCRSPSKRQMAAAGTINMASASKIQPTRRPIILKFIAIDILSESFKNVVELIDHAGFVAAYHHNRVALLEAGVAVRDLGFAAVRDAHDQHAAPQRQVFQRHAAM